MLVTAEATQKLFDHIEKVENILGIQWSNLATIANHNSLGQPSSTKDGKDTSIEGESGTNESDDGEEVEGDEKHD